MKCQKTWQTYYDVTAQWVHPQTGHTYIASTRIWSDDSTSKPQAIANPAESGAIAILSGLLGLTLTWAVIAALVIGLTKGRLSYKIAVSNEVQTPVEQNQQHE